MIVPFFNPGIGAECVEIFEEKLTGSVVFTLQIDTTMVVNVILPAIPESDKHQLFINSFSRVRKYIPWNLPGLVLVGESGVERSRAQFDLFTHDEVINLISVWILEDSWIRNGDRVGQTVTIYFEKWKFADGLNKTAKSASIRNLSAANNVYLITLVFTDWPKSQVVFVIPFIFANFENKFSLNYYYMYLKKLS